ncbi:uncharacterized protein, partial [Euwallacea fornicatus]|uniref:uncharacterized protein n=1 Tax=Euwallacea fornicatus TaxID=995702 RepID=UPI0033904E5C
REDVSFWNTEIAEDTLSEKSFADPLLFKLKDRAFTVAMDETKPFHNYCHVPGNENCVAGVLILNPVQKCDFGRVYSGAMLEEGKYYKSATEFMNYINRKVDVFEQFRCEIYRRHYLLCVKQKYSKAGCSMMRGKYFKG